MTLFANSHLPETVLLEKRSISIVVDLYDCLYNVVHRWGPVFTLSVRNAARQSTDSHDKFKLAGLSSLSLLLGVATTGVSKLQWLNS